MTFAADAIFDPDILPDVLGDSDPAVLIDFYDIFLSFTAESWQELVSSAKSGNWQKVSTLAHSLKSSSRSIGALTLGSAMAELEKTTEEGAAADDLLQRISTIVDVTFERVRLHRVRIDASSNFT